MNEELGKLINMKHFEIIKSLSCGRMYIRKISLRSNTTNSYITSVMKLYEDIGLITSNKDKRYKNISLSLKGWKLYHYLNEIIGELSLHENEI